MYDYISICTIYIIDRRVNNYYFPNNMHRTFIYTWIFSSINAFKIVLFNCNPCVWLTISWKENKVWYKANKYTRVVIHPTAKVMFWPDNDATRNDNCLFFIQINSNGLPSHRFGFRLKEKTLKHRLHQWIIFRYLWIKTFVYIIDLSDYLCKYTVLYYYVTYLLISWKIRILINTGY